MAKKPAVKRLSASPALAKKSADRYQQIQDWIVVYFRKKYDDDPSDINLHTPLPSKLVNAQVMTLLIVDLNTAAKEQRWKFNPNSTLTGPELVLAIKPPPPDKPKALSYLIHYIDKRTR